MESLTQGWFQEEPAVFLLPFYQKVYQQEMQDISFINPEIDIFWLSGGRWQGFWRGVLLTPWCMNLLLLPAQEEEKITLVKGQECVLMLPNGAFPFLVSSMLKSARFWQSALFSDMRVFTDLAAAKAAAAEVLKQLFMATEDDVDLSRRELLLPDPWDTLAG